MFELIGQNTDQWVRLYSKLLLLKNAIMSLVEFLSFMMSVIDFFVPCVTESCEMIAGCSSLGNN